MEKAPALFIGHGSPTNALEENAFTQAWHAMVAQGPRPRAVLVISAHWFFGTTAITAMERPRTIHDFYGFPEPLASFQYPAPGDPALAAEIAELAQPFWVGLDQDQWGLDHGAWSVLTHLFPKADVPVLQLSLSAVQPWDYHLALGRRLSALRDRGVMVLGSGNVVHNLRRMNRNAPDAAYDWAVRFDDAVAAIVEQDPARIADIAAHPDFAMAVPTPDHFLPLLYLAGMAAEEGKGLERTYRAYSMGGLSMSCFAVP